MRELKIEIRHDDDVASPCDDCCTWKLYSFNRSHASFADPSRFTPPNIGLQRKLKVGLAFWLSYSEHGLCAWSLSSGGINCGWDSVRLAGILVWENKPGDIGAKTLESRREDARNFLEVYTDWCNGTCYYYSIEDAVTEEAVASCGGFIGTDHLLDAIMEELHADDVIEVVADDDDEAGAWQWRLEEQIELKTFAEDAITRYVQFIYCGSLVLYGNAETHRFMLRRDPDRNSYILALQPQTLLGFKWFDDNGVAWTASSSVAVWRGLAGALESAIAVATGKPPVHDYWRQQQLVDARVARIRAMRRTLLSGTSDDLIANMHPDRLSFIDGVWYGAQRMLEESLRNHPPAVSVAAFSDHVTMAVAHSLVRNTMRPAADVPAVVVPAKPATRGLRQLAFHGEEEDDEG